VTPSKACRKLPAFFNFKSVTNGAEVAYVAADNRHQLPVVHEVPQQTGAVIKSQSDGARARRFSRARAVSSLQPRDAQAA